MRVREHSKHIPFSIKKANTFSKRLKGLMFKKDPLVNEGLWITPCNSIHMFFMKFSIDAIFLNKNGRVVKLVEGLKPWQIVSPVKDAHSVIELPIGTIQKLRLTPGELITANCLAIY